MYLVDCRQCRTQYSNDATICPVCGHLARRIRAVPLAGRSVDPIRVTRGETAWEPIDRTL